MNVSGLAGCHSTFHGVVAGIHFQAGASFVVQIAGTLTLFHFFYTFETGSFVFD